MSQDYKMKLSWPKGLSLSASGASVDIVDVEQGYARALNCFYNGDRDGALEICVQLLKLNSDFSPARHMRKHIEQKMSPRVMFTAMALYQRYYYDIGDYSYGVPNVLVERPTSADEKLRIGSFCTFADQVWIFLGSDATLGALSNYPFQAPNFGEIFTGAGPLSLKPGTNGGVTIGHDVHLGHGSMILAGSCIGTGSVIEKGSVVSGDIPKFSVVAGNPARVIRQRFSPVDIEKIERIAWWHWPISKITRNLALICSDDPAALDALMQEGLAN
jgi:acetyltransferase-like isoleucine patch superfamily enzyme